MKPTTFFRVLKPKPEEKERALLEMVQSPEHSERFSASESEFGFVPNTPFAYWVGRRLRELFVTLPSFERSGRNARITNPAGDDNRYIRSFWEVPSKSVGRVVQWVPLAKGGTYSPYYADVHLLVDWDEEQRTYRGFQGTPHRPLKKPASLEFFFKPGLTWSRRTSSGLSMRALPAESIFHDKGPGIFFQSDHNPELFALLGFANCLPFKYLINLSIAAGDAAARSYEVGLIQNAPVPDLTPEQVGKLAPLGNHAHDLKRSLDTGNEVSHAFRLPWLLQFGGETLAERGSAVTAFQEDVERQLREIQEVIDELAFDLYGLSEEDRALVRAEMGAAPEPVEDEEGLEEELEEEEAEDGEEEESAAEDLSLHVNRLLSWCVGVVFARWDVRFALDKTLLPELQGAFERLPVVAPAGLVGPDGYPAEAGRIVSEGWLRARPNVISLPEGVGEDASLIDDRAYPLDVQWDGILVSDPSSARDLAARVREVLAVVFGERAEAIEAEAVAILKGEGRKPDSLEQYFADPRQFFETHLRQYSKSRRKAPIYWPLQTKSGFTVWLYYPRITQDSLPRVLSEVLAPRLSFQRQQVTRLESQQAKYSSGPEFTRLNRELDAARELRGELEAMEAEVRRLIDAGYRVDHNDGVILSAAPLHQLIAWKDAAKEFKNLEKGKYPWCTQHQTWSKA